LFYFVFALPVLFTVVIPGKGTLNNFSAYESIGELLIIFIDSGDLYHIKIGSMEDIVALVCGSDKSKTKSLPVSIFF